MWLELAAVTPGNQSIQHVVSPPGRHRRYVFKGFCRFTTVLSKLCWPRVMRDNNGRFTDLKDSLAAARRRRESVSSGCGTPPPSLTPLGPEAGVLCVLRAGDGEAPRFE